MKQSANQQRSSFAKRLGKLHLRTFFASHLLVALPVLLVTNLIFYAVFVPLYQQEVMKINLETVKGINLAFERYVLSPLEQTYLSLIRETSIDITAPLRVTTPKDTWKLYQTHQYMKSLVDTSDGLLSRVEVYYHTTNFINGSGGYLNADDTNNLLYPDWLDQIDLSKETQWICHTEEKQYSRLNPTTQKVVYFCRAFSGKQPENRKMTFVFTMPESSLQNILIQQIGFENYEFAALSAEGQLILCTPGYAHEMKAISPVLKDGNTSSPFRIDKHLVTVLSTQKGDLHFIFSIPEEFYFVGTNQIKQSIMLLFSLALMVVLLFSRVTARRMFHPIEQMNQTASTALKAIGVVSSNQDDHYSTIHEALDVLSNRVQDLDTQLETYRPRLRTNFYRDLLFSGRLGQMDIEDRMATFGIKPYPNYRVMMIQFRDDPKDPNLTELQRMQIYEFIKGANSPDFGTFVTLHEENSIIAIFSYMEESVMDRLLQQVFEQISIPALPTPPAFIAVGRRQDDIFGVRTSLSEAKTAIRYGFLYPQQILSYESFAEWETSQALLACINGERLFNLITDLATPQAAEAAQAFTNELHQQIYEQPFAFLYLRYALLGIYASCIEQLSTRGVYIDKLYSQKAFARFERTQTFEEYETVLLETLGELAERIQMKRGNANYDTVTKVQRYVQEHLQEQLSLRMVSDHFHISYSHMSKVFKEISGMNFTEYVLQCRLEESIQLLMDTNLNLDVIAKKVGIGNAGYYIRTFKAKYGVTPKQYRLAHVQS